MADNIGIELTQAYTNDKIVVNPLLIERSKEDAVTGEQRKTNLYLVNGSSVEVLESLDEILQKTKALGAEPRVLPYEARWFW